MSIRRLSNSTISTQGKGKSSNLIAGYSPAIDEMDLIERATVGAGGTANITFSSIPQTYQHLQLRGIIRGTNASSVDFGMYVGGNNTLDTAANYSVHILFGVGPTGTVFGGYTNQTSYYWGAMPAANASSGVLGPFIVDIFDYASSSKNKVARASCGREEGTIGRIDLDSSAWYSTTPINIIRVYVSPGNLAEYTTVSLYGVKA